MTPLVQNAGFLAEGLALSLVLTVIAVLGGLMFGTVLAAVRVFGGRVGGAAVGVYVFAFRAIPLILVVFWFYFMVPLALGRPVGAFTSAVVAFILFEAAYYSEIIRGGIASIRPGQMDAARALGMSRIAAMRYIVLPQAFRAMIPVFLTQAIVLFQDTSLVFVVSLHDFLTAATIVANREGRLVETYFVACFVYYVVCLGATAAAERVWARRDGSVPHG